MFLKTKYSSEYNEINAATKFKLFNWKVPNIKNLTISGANVIKLFTALSYDFS
jgi:hypothetical protein